MAINDPTIERLPPHALDAEEALIGSILIDPSAFNRVTGLVDGLDFFREGNRYVFEAAQTLFDRQVSINLVTIARELEDRGRLDTAGGRPYLSTVMAETPTSLHAEYYAAIVRRTSIQRKMINAAGQ